MDGRGGKAAHLLLLVSERRLARLGGGAELGERRLLVEEEVLAALHLRIVAEGAGWVE